MPLLSLVTPGTWSPFELGTTNGLASLNLKILSSDPSQLLVSETRLYSLGTALSGLLAPAPTRPLSDNLILILGWTGSDASSEIPESWECVDPVPDNLFRR